MQDDRRPSRFLLCRARTGIITHGAPRAGIWLELDRRRCNAVPVVHWTMSYCSRRAVNEALASFLRIRRCLLHGCWCQLVCSRCCCQSKANHSCYTHEHFKSRFVDHIASTALGSSVPDTLYSICRKEAYFFIVHEIQLQTVPTVLLEVPMHSRQSYVGLKRRAFGPCKDGKTRDLIQIGVLNVPGGVVVSVAALKISYAWCFS